MRKFCGLYIWHHDINKSTIPEQENGKEDAKLLCLSILTKVLFTCLPVDVIESVCNTLLMISLLLDSDWEKSALQQIEKAEKWKSGSSD